MIKKFGDYEQTKAYTDAEMLPKGAYVVKIMGATVEENSNGQYIKIGCDIAEGEFKDFYANQYKQDQREDKKWKCNYLLNVPKDDGTQEDGWTKRKFKTFTEALEDSNEGYHFDWDEKKFKGKHIGGLFNEQEFVKNDGSVGKTVKIGKVISVQALKEGKYKMPEDKILTTTNKNSSSDTFMNLPDSIEEELPFN